MKAKENRGSTKGKAGKRAVKDLPAKAQRRLRMAPSSKKRSPTRRPSIPIRSRSRRSHRNRSTPLKSRSSERFGDAAGADIGELRPHLGTASAPAVEHCRRSSRIPRRAGLIGGVDRLARSRMSPTSALDAPTRLNRRTWKYPLFNGKANPKSLPLPTAAVTLSNGPCAHVPRRQDSQEARSVSPGLGAANSTASRGDTTRPGATRPARCHVSVRPRKCGRFNTS